MNPKKKPYIIELNILLINREANPAVQLRKTISKKSEVRDLVTRAMRDGEIPAKIVFKDRFQAAIKLKALDLL